MLKERIVKNKLLAIIVLVVVIILGAAGWYFGSPLFLNKTVDEELVFATSAETDTQISEEQVSAPDPSDDSTEVMTEVSDDDSEDMTGEVSPASSDATVSTTEEQMVENDEPVILKKGGFVDADNFHQGSGTATVYESDGQRVLRLANFMVTNGPDLHVYLATSSKATGRDDLGEYVDLGKLKGNVDNQNYEIPADVDLSLYNSVVIYCAPFHVVFSTATIR